MFNDQNKFNLLKDLKLLIITDFFNWRKSLAQNRTTFVPIKTQLSLVVDRMHMSTKSNFFDIFLIVAQNSLLRIE